MAAPDEDEKLDFTSPKFDPLSALYSDQVTPPFPSVVQLNNLLEYERYMMTGELPRAHSKKKSSTSQKTQTRAEALQRLLVKQSSKDDEDAADDSDEPRRGRSGAGRGGRSYRNVLTRMEAESQGPMGLLYKCVYDRIPIRVCTRTFRGLRGLCSGYLVAYDKYWNLAMVDVDEVYKKPSLGKKLFNEERLTFSKLNDNRSGHVENLQAEKHSPPKYTSDHGDFVPERQPVTSTTVQGTSEMVGSNHQECSEDKEDRRKHADKGKAVREGLKIGAGEEASGMSENSSEIMTLEEELDTLKQQLSLLQADEGGQSPDSVDKNSENSDEVGDGDHDGSDNIHERNDSDDDNDDDDNDNETDHIDDEAAVKEANKVEQLSDDPDALVDRDADDGNRIEDDNDDYDDNDLVDDEATVKEADKDEQLPDDPDVLVDRSAGNRTEDDNDDNDIYSDHGDDILDKCVDVDTGGNENIDYHHDDGGVKQSESDRDCTEQCQDTNKSGLILTETSAVTLEVPSNNEQNVDNATERTHSNGQTGPDSESKARVIAESMKDSEHTPDKASTNQPVVRQKRGKRIIEHGEFIRRHVNQLFIRGDNVVMVMVCRDKK
ncbi:protein starmaker-like [Ptychodera flava]|uniref:protein starmaker-like n=1 Tax=Ptychodera flava TaxID=63121 RepID=UPI00396A3CCD